MILFFGTRSGKTRSHSLPHTFCPYCEQQGTLTVYKTSNWFHIFWIRIFKISTNMMAECSHCKRGFHKEEFSEDMSQQLIQIESQAK
ncbi:zinc-ribbon domain-containing protein [Euzebyella marina]|uniref:Zinc-ribbon domain-containing protein n=1 Tax=Euzebyella marina TaxID=1761453 RepID=A0A3G2L3S4_9FLAO|nr:zinc-ribbon domain-containing protein [Euzebyella marina]AYN66871.1 zinc-ribbon domain-containing protein [Euzebyella marina]